jgi:hypothetical protein
VAKEDQSIMYLDDGDLILISDALDAFKPSHRETYLAQCRLQQYVSLLRAKRGLLPATQMRRHD